MAKINLTEKVKAMTLTEATMAASNVASCGDEEQAEKILTALVKLKALQEIIDPAIKNAEKVLSNFVKKGDDLSGNADMKRANAVSGRIEDVNITVDIAKQVIDKESIDSDTLKNDLGVVVTEDDNNPGKIIIEISDPKNWKLFKTVAVTVNPTAVAAAINNGTLDSKYRVNTPQQKIIVVSETKTKEA